MALFDIKDLSFTYPGGAEKTLDGFSLTVGRGDFLVITGPTGCGKTTLLRLMKPELTMRGQRTGDVLFRGRDVSALSATQSARIGFVLQDPAQQTVTDRVRHEVVFGMESLNFPQGLMKRRCAEIMSAFLPDDLFDAETDSLSGGKKQLLALASVLAADPDAVILDEPTSQLDPAAASDFILTLKKLNDETGLTVIMTEHRLQNVLPAATKLCAMENGRVLACGKPGEVISSLRGNARFIAGMPAEARLWTALGAGGDCPVGIAQGRAFAENLPVPENAPITENGAEKQEKKTAENAGKDEKKVAAEMKNVFFRYEKNAPDVLRGLSLKIYEGELLTVLGANAGGKSTLLSVLAGLKRHYAGKITVFGKKTDKYKPGELYSGCLSLLPQDVSAVFLKNTLREELESAGAELSDLPADLSYAADTHPYDLSGGERQLAALGIALASKPRLLLLDEPTKGLDNEAKALFGNALRGLTRKGVAVVAVTHDVEFAADFADRAAMLFRGEIVCEGQPDEFFRGNVFYTPAAAKITKDTPFFALTPEKAAERYGRL